MNNVRECPQCEKIALQQKEKQLEELNRACGVVSPEEYLKLREECKPIRLNETYGEYYEVGIWKGKFRYSGFCEDCGFHFSFEESKDLDYNVQMMDRVNRDGIKTSL